MLSTRDVRGENILPLNQTLFFFYQTRHCKIVFFISVGNENEKMKLMNCVVQFITITKLCNRACSLNNLVCIIAKFKFNNNELVCGILATGEGRSRQISRLNILRMKNDVIFNDFASVL